MINNFNNLAPLALLCSRIGVRGQELFRKVYEIHSRGEGGAWDVLEAQELAASYDRAHLDLQRWAASGIAALVFGTPSYPALLATIYEPPLILFAMGSLPSYWPPAAPLAIVGSRSADVEGCYIAENFAAKLGERGACVVSGLALGVDSAAHRGALTSGQAPATVAVLGSGLNRLYPASNRKLAEKIVESGSVVLSQFEPDEPPYPVNFLKRNRIIAGMSLGTLVVQAGARSGSLVTARFALDEGRDVFVVPGPASDERYRGSHELIKQGAYLVTDVQDISDVLSVFKENAEKRAAIKRTNSVEVSIVETIKKAGTIHFNEIQKGIAERGDLNVHLLELELSGVIRRLPGNFWAIQG